MLRFLVLLSPFPYILRFQMTHVSNEMSTGIDQQVWEVEL